MFERIVLPTDFSPFSNWVFPVAAGLARRHGAEISLVHVFEFPPPLGSEIAITGLEPTINVLETRLRLLAREAIFDGLAVRPRLFQGHGPTAFLDNLDPGERDLIVLSTHGRTGFRHLVLGSFAERAVQLAPCPVLTVRCPGEECYFKSKRILYPHDFSELSTHAVDTVRSFADAYGAEVHVYHVLQDPAVPIPETSFGDETSWAHVEDRAAELLRQFATESFEPRVRAKSSVDSGHAALRIIDKARSIEADLIILATHGRTGLSHALLGSVAERVVRQAPCSVLTVRPRAEAAARRSRAEATKNDP